LGIYSFGLGIWILFCLLFLSVIGMLFQGLTEEGQG
jgi:hypothetical protein